MADINDILNITQDLGINDHRFVGQSLSRNQRIFTSEISTVVPFEITMNPHNYLRYQINRGLLNSLRIADKSLEQYLNFANTGYLSMVAYQGTLTPAQIAQSSWSITSTNQNLVLTLPAGVAPNTVIVRAGDYCQVNRYTYIATQDVIYTAGTTVNISVHRTLVAPITTPVNAVIGQYGTTIILGTQVWTGITLPVILRDYPTYSLKPFIANDFYIEWSGAFKAFENVLVAT